MVRLVLTDDHKIIREGIRALLQEDKGIQVVGEAANGKELLELLQATPADVVMLDIHMPGMDGYETIKKLRQCHPGVKVLVFSMLENERYVHQMMDVGAAGYLLKTTSTEELRYAIKLIAGGLHYISPALTLNLLRKAYHAAPAFAGKAQQGSKNFKELSKRETEVLHLILEGFTNAKISQKLFTSKRTIETHRQNLLEKTQTKNTAALIKFAFINGIIS
jgi:DNA-binding NarL/FixJ family response regulator